MGLLNTFIPRGNEVRMSFASCRSCHRMARHLDQKGRIKASVGVGMRPRFTVTVLLAATGVTAVEASAALILWDGKQPRRHRDRCVGGEVVTIVDCPWEKGMWRRNRH